MHAREAAASYGLNSQTTFADRAYVSQSTWSGGFSGRRLVDGMGFEYMPGTEDQ